MRKWIVPSSHSSTMIFSLGLIVVGYTSIHIDQTHLLQPYLEQICFFKALAKVKQVMLVGQNAKAPIEEGLLQLQTYTYKPEFYGSYETFIATLKHIGLSDDMSMLVTSSLGEIVDNAFSHNIGQWSSDIGPLVIAFMQNNTEQRILYPLSSTNNRCESVFFSHRLSAIDY